MAARTVDAYKWSAAVGFFLILFIFKGHVTTLFILQVIKINAMKNAIKTANILTMSIRLLEMLE